MKQKTIRKIGYRAWSKSGPIPFIPIQGKFLESYGFRLGDKVRVDYSPGRIVITAQGKQEAEP